MATAAQITANQLNAQRSTGPHNCDTTRGNALRHGLTSKQLLIPGEDPAAFQALLHRFQDSFGPVGEVEGAYVSQLAEHEWRLTRARRVESATLHLYVNRHLEEAEGNHDIALALAFERHGKELDRLRRYENSISRAFDQILDKLGKLIRVRHLLESQAAPEDSDEILEDDASAESFGFVSNSATQPIPNSSHHSEFHHPGAKL